MPVTSAWIGEMLKRRRFHQTVKSEAMTSVIPSDFSWFCQTEFINVELKRLRQCDNDTQQKNRVLNSWDTTVLWTVKIICTAHMLQVRTPPIHCTLQHTAQPLCMSLKRQPQWVELGLQLESNQQTYVWPTQMSNRTFTGPRLTWRHLGCPSCKPKSMRWPVVQSRTPSTLDDSDIKDMK